MSWCFDAHLADLFLRERAALIPQVDLEENPFQEVHMLNGPSEWIRIVQQSA